MKNETAVPLAGLPPAMSLAARDDVAPSVRPASTASAASVLTDMRHLRCVIRRHAGTRGEWRRRAFLSIAEQEPPPVSESIICQSLGRRGGRSEVEREPHSAFVMVRPPGVLARGILGGIVGDHLADVAEQGAAPGEARPHPEPAVEPELIGRGPISIEARDAAALVLAAAMPVENSRSGVERGAVVDERVAIAAEAD